MTNASACRRRAYRRNGAEEVLWYARRIFEKMNDFERLHYEERKEKAWIERGARLDHFHAEDDR
jgi:hypothetical protein